MNNKSVITIAYGDGIGPEIMEGTLFVLREAGAELEIETIQIGSRIYSMGSDTGILPSSWESLKRTGILLKGPVIKPESDTIKSVTAALCERFNLPQESQIVNECAPGIVAHAYIGEAFALFEPTQEALPELAGKNKAHPAAMILASTLLLKHLGQEETAERIHMALVETLVKNKKRIKTKKFAEAVVKSLSSLRGASATKQSRKIV